MKLGLDRGSAYTRVALPTIAYPSKITPGDWASPLEYRSNFWNLTGTPQSTNDQAVLAIACLLQSSSENSFQIATNSAQHEKTIWKELLEGTHDTRIHGQTRTISIKVLAVIPNGFGGFLHYALDGEGNKIAHRIKPTTILDCGQSKLTILNTDNDGKIREQKEVSWLPFYKAIKDHVQRDTGKRISNDQIREALTGEWQGPDIKSIFAQVIAKEQLLIKREITPSSQMIIHGGFATLLHPLYPKATILSPFANAEGLHKITIRAARKLPQ